MFDPVATSLLLNLVAAIVLMAIFPVSFSIFPTTDLHLSSILNNNKSAYKSNKPSSVAAAIQFSNVCTSEFMPLPCLYSHVTAK